LKLFQAFFPGVTTIFRRAAATRENGRLRHGERPPRIRPRSRPSLRLGSSNSSRDSSPPPSAMSGAELCHV
jgi:hypothetical protein